MSADNIDHMELMARTDAARISGFTLDETDLADIDAREADDALADRTFPGRQMQAAMLDLQRMCETSSIKGFELTAEDLADIDARMPLAQPEYADPVTGFEPTEDAIRMPDMAAIRDDLADAVYASSLNTIYVTDAAVDASVVAEVNN